MAGADSEPLGRERQQTDPFVLGLEYARGMLKALNAPSFDAPHLLSYTERLLALPPQVSERAHTREFLAAVAARLTEDPVRGHAALRASTERLDHAQAFSSALYFPMLCAHDAVGALALTQEKPELKPLLELLAGRGVEVAFWARVQSNDTGELLSVDSPYHYATSALRLLEPALRNVNRGSEDSNGQVLVGGVVQRLHGYAKGEPLGLQYRSGGESIDIGYQFRDGVREQVMECLARDPEGALELLARRTDSTLPERYPWGRLTGFRWFGCEQRGSDRVLTWSPGARPSFREHLDVALLVAQNPELKRLYAIVRRDDVPWGVEAHADPHTTFLGIHTENIGGYQNFCSSTLRRDYRRFVEYMLLSPMFVGEGRVSGFLFPPEEGERSILCIGYHSPRGTGLRRDGRGHSTVITLDLPTPDAREALRIVGQYPNQGLTTVVGAIAPELKTYVPWGAVGSLKWGEVRFHEQGRPTFTSQDNTPGVEHSIPEIPHP